MTDRPARTEAIDISPVEDGYVVYDPDRDMVHYLNHTAAMTLELCDGARSVPEIVAYLAELFPGTDAVQASVPDCVSQLRELGLVAPAAATPVIPAQAGPVAAADNRQLS